MEICSGHAQRQAAVTELDAWTDMWSLSSTRSQAASCCETGIACGVEWTRWGDFLFFCIHSEAHLDVHNSSWWITSLLSHPEEEFEALNGNKI